MKSTIGIMSTAAAACGGGGVSVVAGSRQWRHVLHVYLVLSLATCGSVRASCGSGTPFTNWFWLDHNYLLCWAYDTSNVIFEIQVRALGYVGLGLSPTGGMKDADIVIGWISNGQPYFTDRHGHSTQVSANSEPQMDSHQDWVIQAAYENATHTVFRFTRLLDTCDGEDYPITEDTMRLIYAYRNTDPINEVGLLYHGQANRGSRIVRLLGTVTPHYPLPVGTITWNVNMNGVSVPPGLQNSYFCQIFKVPEWTSKRHLIMYSPQITGSNAPYVHHMLLYSCSNPAGDLSIIGQSVNCYSELMGTAAWDCRMVIAGWAIGGGDVSLPESIGLSFGAPGDPQYVMLQVHYDNYQNTAGIYDQSGLSMYITSAVRRQDAGILPVGVAINYTQIVPPAQRSFTSYGHCVGECTRTAFPSQGITVYGGWLHTHSLGRAVKLCHIRNGVELPPLFSDNHYDYSYQESIILKVPIQVLPGDELITECTYSSVPRPNTVTYGGLGASNEMCMTYVFYAPKLALSTCQSEVSMDDLLTAVNLDPYVSGNTIPTPAPLPPLTRQIFTNWVNTQLNWSDPCQVKQLRDTNLRGAHTAVCQAGVGIPFSGVHGRSYHFPVIRVSQPEPISRCPPNLTPSTTRSPGELSPEQLEALCSGATGNPFTNPVTHPTSPTVTTPASSGGFKQFFEAIIIWFQALFTSICQLFGTTC